MNNMLRFFRHLVSSPSPQFAFWFSDELEDLAPVLGEIFEVSSLHRDYENAWEWLEGSSRQGFRVNISHTHDSRNGHYHLPAVVTLMGSGRRLGYTESVTWMKKLAERLGVEVSAGTMVEGTAPAAYGFRIDEVVAEKKKANQIPPLTPDIIADRLH